MILACDLGTSYLKSALIDLSGRRCFFTNILLKRPEPRLWLKAFKCLCAGISPRLKKDILALSLCAHGPSLVPVSSSGQALYRIIFWKESLKAKNREGLKSFFLAGIKDFFRQNPALKAKTAFLLAPAEYLAFILTGEKATSVPHADYIPYYWERAELNTLGLDPALFPAFIFCHQPVGEVSRKAGLEFGIAPGLKVFCGGPDFLMALLGTGTITPGLVNDRGGSSEAFNTCSTRPQSQPGLRCLPSFKQGLYNLSSLIPEAGSVLSLLKNWLWGRRTAWEDFNKQILTSLGPAIGVFYPVKELKQGRLTRASLLHSFYGRSRFYPDRADMVKAFFEYLAYCLKHYLDELDMLKLSYKEIRVCGGLAKNPLLCQIKADISGKPVILYNNNPEAELFGLALIAWHGLGLINSYEEALLDWLKPGKVYCPQASYANLYAERYRLYRNRIEEER